LSDDITIHTTNETVHIVGKDADLYIISTEEIAEKPELAIFLAELIKLGVNSGATALASYLNLKWDKKLKEWK
jgi:hypothetical protein